MISVVNIENVFAFLGPPTRSNWVSSCRGAVSIKPFYYMPSRVYQAFLLYA